MNHSCLILMIFYQIFLYMTERLSLNYKTMIGTILFCSSVELLSFLDEIFSMQPPNFSLSSVYYLLKSLVYNKYNVFIITIFIWLQTLMKLVFNISIVKNIELMPILQYIIYLIYLPELEASKICLLCIQQIFVTLLQVRINMYPDYNLKNTCFFILGVIVLRLSVQNLSFETLVFFFLNYVLFYAFVMLSLFYWGCLAHLPINRADRLISSTFRKVSNNIKTKLAFTILGFQRITKVYHFYGYLWLSMAVFPELFSIFGYIIFSDYLFTINCFTIYLYSIPLAFMMNLSQGVTGRSTHLSTNFTIFFSILVYIWAFGFELGRYPLSVFIWFIS